MATTLELEQQMQAALDAQAIPMALEIRRDTDGRRTRLYYGSGWAPANHKGTMSSCSKAPNLLVVMDLIAQGLLSLDARIADLIPEMGALMSAAQAPTTIRDCLAFRSPFTKINGYQSNNPAVFQQPGTATWSAYEQRVIACPTQQQDVGKGPGTFVYQTTHEDVLSIAAVRAKGALDWKTLWDAMRASKGILATATPSSAASTVVYAASQSIDCTTGEYLDFLVAARDAQLLPAVQQWQWLSDVAPKDLQPQRVYEILDSTQNRYGLPIEDWRWCQGFWRESRRSVPEPLTQRWATVGLAGQYNAIDLSHGYIYVGSRYPVTTPPANALTGLPLFGSLRPVLESWAALSQ